jgi:isocitrate dehydrogenase
MNKIKVDNPVVELDGDEMTRIIWQFIKDQLILPYLDVDTRILRPRYRIPGPHRRPGDDRLGRRRSSEVRRRREVRDHHARRSPRQGVQPEEDVEVAERHDPQHPRRRHLPRADHLLEHPAPRARLDASPIVVGRHAFGDQYRATDFKVPGHRHAHPHVHADDGGEPIEPRRVYTFRRLGRRDGDVQRRRRRSATSPARRSATASQRNYPVYLSTKNTILKAYDGRFKDIFAGGLRHGVQAADYEKAGLTYEHRLIDDMVAACPQVEGGYVWACKNYDGDVQSDTVAQGFGSLGLMTSVLMTPDGKTVEAEAAHGTVTRHYRQHQKGKPTSTNPIASIFAWTRGLAHRGKLDGDARGHQVRRHPRSASRIKTVEEGKMTKDLALLIGPSQAHMTTEGYLEAVRANLEKAMKA